jgi:hypothetical protein
MTSATVTSTGPITPGFKEFEVAPSPAHFGKSINRFKVRRDDIAHAAAVQGCGDASGLRSPKYYLVFPTNGVDLSLISFHTKAYQSAPGRELISKYAKLISCRMTRFWREGTTGVMPVVGRLKLDLLGHLESVVHLNPEISDGALQLRMSEEQLKHA